MAYGLPVEGDDGPFLGAQLTEVLTCDVTGTVADARRALDAAGADAVVLVHAGGLALGEVDVEALNGQADGVDLLDILDPVPTTVRPSVTVGSLAGSGGGERLVTTSDGRLLGRARVAPPTDEPEGDEPDDHGGHDGHDHGDAGHDGHEHGGEPFDAERYEAELTEVMEAIGEHFADREPSADELRAFLHARLVSEGRSAEDADRFLDDLDAGDAG